MKFDQGNFGFEETKKPIQDTTGDVFCPGRRSSRQSFVYVKTWKKVMKAVTKVFKTKRAATDQNRTFLLFGADGTFCFVKQTGRGDNNGKISQFLKKFYNNPNQPHPKQYQNR